MAFIYNDQVRAFLPIGIHIFRIEEGLCDGVRNFIFIYVFAFLVPLEARDVKNLQGSLEIHRNKISVVVREVSVNVGGLWERHLGLTLLQILLHEGVYRGTKIDDSRVWYFLVLFWGLRVIENLSWISNHVSAEVVVHSHSIYFLPLQIHVCEILLQAESLIQVKRRLRARGRPCF